MTSVPEFETAIDAYIAQRNVDPTPFTWTASVQKILAKVKKAKDTLASLPRAAGRDRGDGTE
jgi:hypothetical protein